MAERIYLFALTKLQAQTAREALHSALAGDPSEGDFCWTEREQKAADEAAHRLARPTCLVIEDASDVADMWSKSTEDAN